ncbi:MAG: pyruvate ferredoxin oxidoreductase [Candidatus Lokiarchaeota archaeon]|nr:pyruvate ferredoxin oxidoreductase [Candidatus Lokiarchaeota archaeon]
MSEFEGKRLVKGNFAASYAARAANVQVVTAFPITPQTLVVEKISELVDSGKMNCEFVRMESEHSVMAGLIGASYAGARTFSATSGQGLLYMAEPVHWAAGTRLPIVMTIASRGIAPPWNIWADFSDIVTQRDSGWLMALLSGHQEIYDSVLMAYKISENPDVMLPYMLAYGGFILSHTSKPIHMPKQSLIDEFLPKIPKLGWDHVFLDPDRPIMHGNLIMPNTTPGYQEFRMKIQLAQLKAKPIIREVAKEFKETFGRDYGNGMVQEYKCKDAEFIMINCGILAKQMENVVDFMRSLGHKVGMLRLRTYRPFPTEDIIDAVKHAKIIGVVDRATAFGSPTGGPISSETMAALHNDPQTKDLRVIPFINGIGGRDVVTQQQKRQFEILMECYDKGELVKNEELMSTTYWTGAMGVK